MLLYVIVSPEFILKKQQQYNIN